MIYDEIQEYMVLHFLARQSFSLTQNAMGERYRGPYTESDIPAAPKCHTAETPPRLLTPPLKKKKKKGISKFACKPSIIWTCSRHPP